MVTSLSPMPTWHLPPTVVALSRVRLFVMEESQHCRPILPLQQYHHIRWMTFLGLPSAPQSTKKTRRRTGGDGETLTDDSQPGTLNYRRTRREGSKSGLHKP
jgi:hypothetical protein